MITLDPDRRPAGRIVLLRAMTQCSVVDDVAGDVALPLEQDCDFRASWRQPIIWKGLAADPKKVSLASTTIATSAAVISGKPFIRCGRQPSSQHWALLNLPEFRLEAALCAGVFRRRQQIQCEY